MCLLSVNKEGYHIQKFQNSFLSLENVYLLRTSSRSLTCFSLCHWPPLSQNRGDFWAIASVIFCIWQVWQSGCPHHMEKLTEWPFNNLPGKPIEGTRSVTQKINGWVREQKHGCYHWHRPFFLSAKYYQLVFHREVICRDQIKQCNFYPLQKEISVDT